MTLDRWICEDQRLKEISSPLGGIGSGSIGLAGSGRLVDWEFFNRPSKGSVNGYSHFAGRDGKAVAPRRPTNVASAGCIPPRRSEGGGGTLLLPQQPPPAWMHARSY